MELLKNIDKKHPLLDALTKLEVGGYIDVHKDCKISGNYISARISMWIKANKLLGKFSRRKIDNDIMRIFRVQ